MVRGCEIRPTQRSVVARQRSKSLDGGWSDDSLWRAIRIRAFPRNAVTDRKEFTPESNIKLTRSPALKSVELHKCCSTDFFSLSSIVCQCHIDLQQTITKIQINSVSLAKFPSVAKLWSGSTTMTIIMNVFNSFYSACYFLKYVSTWITDNLERKRNEQGRWGLQFYDFGSFSFDRVVSFAT